MYLSVLFIDTGGNPDRPRPGRLWLRNAYPVHQRLCMAFPSTAKAAQDPAFLAPYVREEFADVKVMRSQEQGFLFRVDPLPGNRAAILVQSAREPDWGYAFKNAGHLLAGPPMTKPYDPQFKEGASLRFRLLANPVRTVSKRSLDASGKPLDMAKWRYVNKKGKERGREVPVPKDQLGHWLQRRAEPDWRAIKNAKDQQAPGFRIENLSSTQPGYVFVSKGRDESDQSDEREQAGDDTGSAARRKATRRASALYDGILAVTNVEDFRATLIRGIGPGKAFGFGLLSVAPVRD